MAISILKPFRQYDEHDVINMFAFDTSVAATALDSKGKAHVLGGKLVKVKGDGWKNDADDLWTTEVAGGTSYNNTLALRYNLVAQVEPADADDTNILGMLLHDVREEDENGEKLKFNPRKADEMQCVIKGQAVPLVTRGIFLVSNALSAQAGVPLYVNATGDLTATSGGGSIVAHTLGDTDANDNTLIRLAL
jgi:hypothetical protein